MTKEVSQKGASNSEIFNKVVNITMEKLGVNADLIKENSSFIEDLKADSLDVVEIVMGLEDEFGIEINEEDSSKIKTVGDAVKYLEEKTK